PDAADYERRYPHLPDRSTPTLRRIGQFQATGWLATASALHALGRSGRALISAFVTGDGRSRPSNGDQARPRGRALSAANATDSKRSPAGTRIRPMSKSLHSADNPARDSTRITCEPKRDFRIVAQAALSTRLLLPARSSSDPPGCPCRSERRAEQPERRSTCSSPEARLCAATAESPIELRKAGE